ncbi:hypothetical protein [Flexithrix dorotheae]|uniref:hypothetical protein n=1 Tax=Flexithrix dorotheae TaxID=70993 RepID=UPI0003753E36|nr:hypothetical protein [Flexithrix dorotheae]
MSLKLTVIKTKDEHWERSFGFPHDGIRLEFSQEHDIRQLEDVTSVFIKKGSDLFSAFNNNLNKVFQLGVEKALQIVISEIENLDVSNQTKNLLTEKFEQRLKQEAFSG